MQHPFLAGSSEMARRIREFDWTGTPLGAPAGWPQTLKAMVRLALTTQHPIFIFWGSEHTCIYNDAYSASLGPEKHPAILGMKGHLAWPEIWDVIGPQVELVMRGDGATWHENQLVPILRHGELQDVYWTYSFGPIEYESTPANVGGVLVICTETTQQVVATRRLAGERERLARLFEQAPGFMALLSGPEHRFELCNPAYLRLIGHRDVLGHPVAEALPEVASQGYLALLDGVFRSGVAYAASDVSYHLPRSDGSLDQHYLDFVYQPVTDDAGAVIGIFVEGVDVTERTRAESALRDSEKHLREREEQLRLATEAADVGLWDVDLVSGTLYWPARVKAMFGISPDVAVSMADFYAGLHPEDLDRTKEAFEAALDPSRRALYDVEYRTIGKEDRRIRWVAAKGRGVFDEKGDCTRVIGTAIDITHRKADEARLRELNETLEQRVANALADKKILADIVEGTDAFVQVADLEYRFLAINNASADEFERIFGLRPKVGDSMLELLHDQPEHRAAVAAIWSRALSGEEFTATGEFGDSARDRRHYEMKFNTLRDKDGVRVGAYQFVYDITDRILDQTRLARAEDALRQAQKMEAVGQLTGGIAHDFNNVLQAVQGSLQLIRRGSSDHRVQGWADNALRSIKRGAQLTSQLLTFAREQQLESRPLVVSQLLDDMEDMLRRSLGPLVRLKRESTAADATICADPTQLEMAVLNLAINARDAMPQGGALTIASHTCRLDQHASLEPGDYVELVVSDTGAGMPTEILARAFDPFFSTKGVGKGTGLGLSQVYGMARQAGGGAFIRSEVGKGTTVTLLLPQAESVALTIPAPSLPAALDQAHPQCRILVIDDDPEVRSVLVASLESLGHAVMAAEDGPSGLNMLDVAEPDLMIVDFAMPGMNGAEVANRARARHPGLPIVFASGYADTGAIGAAVGPASILRKPFDIGELKTAVKDHLKTASFRSPSR
jgi:PAS domain S-box-containing protein